MNNSPYSTEVGREVHTRYFLLLKEKRLVPLLLTEILSQVNALAQQFKEFSTVLHYALSRVYVKGVLLFIGLKKHDTRLLREVPAVDPGLQPAEGK